MTKIRVVTQAGMAAFLSARGDEGLILSALNIFMLGHLRKNRDFPTHSYFWCDGIFGIVFSRLNGHRVSKLRGAMLTQRLLEYHRGDSICVLGSLSDGARSLLTDREVVIARHYPLPECEVEELSVLPIELDTKAVLITLPSPKQELVALNLSERFPKANFYCIGGAMNMLAHPELDCPALLQRLGFEFLFRLRSDTRRRIVRLLDSMVQATLNLGYLRRCRIEVLD